MSQTVTRGLLELAHRTGCRRKEKTGKDLTEPYPELLKWWTCVGCRLLSGTAAVLCAL